MTAVQHAMTLKRLNDLARLLEFIHEHGDKLGPLTGIGVDSINAKAQIFSWKQKVEDTAAALIAWVYLLDDARIYVGKFERDGGTGAHIEIDGSFCGNTMKAYTGFHDTRVAEYLTSLPQVTVHSLRRIQVGDVPEVVAA
jgi:hypothetical protein